MNRDRANGKAFAAYYDTTVNAISNAPRRFQDDDTIFKLTLGTNVNIMLLSEV